MSIALQIQQALLAAYNAAPLGALPAAIDVHQTADVEGSLPSTSIVMGNERVSPADRDRWGPVVERTLQFDVIHRVRAILAAPTASAATVVDPMRIHTVARLVGQGSELGGTLGGLVIEIVEVGTTVRYSEKTPSVEFVQALDVKYTTARRDLTQPA
jgi:hypothetical protein